MEAPKENVVKSSEIVNVAEEEDIISNKLPESLISYILSLIPTKDAIRTCVLSKAWINRWISITKLDLDDATFKLGECCHCKCVVSEPTLYSNDKGDLTVCKKCYKSHLSHVWSIGERVSKDWYMLEKQQQFEIFVDKILLHTGTKFPISSMELESFSLVIYYKHDVSLLNTWIINILSRRVKKLRIHSSFHKLPFFTLASHFLINSTFLEELDLVLKMFSTIHTLTTIVHFENLKILKLSGIFFEIDLSCDSLTLSLPILNKFEIKNCNCSSGKDIFVEAPLLEVISIEQDIHFHNLVSSDLDASAIRFSTVHLKEFSYRGHDISQQISLSDGNFLSHVSAKIILEQCENRDLALLFLHQLCGVKCIKFERLEVLSPIDIPLFANLSHMELSLVTAEVLLDLLQKTPILKTLILKEIPEFAEELLTSAAVPNCLAYTLQIVKFEKVNGADHEFFLAKFFMENGIALEKMSYSHLILKGR